tara:strand:- start:1277 stop:1525 length:249 start_codon:yes stop_codon:yes gene_type:complete
MGNCQEKTTTVEAIEVTHDKYNTFNQPNNPNEDKEEKYIWLSISVINTQLQKYQEDGFIIAYSEVVLLTSSRIWIRKLRNNE